MIFAGVDAGSRAIKVVLFDREQGRVAGSGLVSQGVRQDGLAAALFDRVLHTAGLGRGDVRALVATGYGRSRIEFASTTVTEITCHARGVYYACPDARSLIEIGGQDSKTVCLEARGRVRDFVMNDRCAAGTGRFLEMLAERLGLDWAALDALGQQSRAPAAISSTCAVFAETEIVGLLADGVPVADIVAGVQRAVADRIAAMAGRLLEPPVYFTGGVALQPGMRRALEGSLGLAIQVAPSPQFTGALGAALMAAAAA